MLCLSLLRVVCLIKRLAQFRLAWPNERGTAGIADVSGDVVLVYLLAWRDGLGGRRDFGALTGLRAIWRCRARKGRFVQGREQATVPT